MGPEAPANNNASCAYITQAHLLGLKFIRKGVNRDSIIIQFTVATTLKMCILFHNHNNIAMNKTNNQYYYNGQNRIQI